MRGQNKKEESVRFCNSSLHLNPPSRNFSAEFCWQESKVHRCIWVRARTCAWNNNQALLTAIHFSTCKHAHQSPDRTSNSGAQCLDIINKAQKEGERKRKVERMLIFEFGNAQKLIFLRKMSGKSSRIWPTMSGTRILAQFHNRTRMSQRKWQAPFTNIPHKLTRQISWKMRIKIQSSEH